MKKKVLCAFALVLWFLLFSTFFSLWVEQTMVPFVTVTESTLTMDFPKPTLPLDCLIPDEEGVPALYQTYEGTGWEEGPRAALTGPQSYMIDLDKIVLEYGGATYIRYASKPPETGKPVNVLLNPQEEPDILLVLGTEGISSLKEDSPKSCRIIDKTDNALLVSLEKSSFPFLPKKADSDLFEADPFGGSERQLYSLSEFQSFAGGIRFLSLLPSLALMVFLLWLYSCFLIKNAKQNRRALLVNGIFAVASLLSVPWILSALQLPSSLLPRSSITDLSHYAREFGEISSALEGFAAAGNQTAAAALEAAGQSLTGSLAIVLGGVLLALALIAAEIFLRKMRAAPRGKHARHTDS